MARYVRISEDDKAMIFILRGIMRKKFYPCRVEELDPVAFKLLLDAVESGIVFPELECVIHSSKTWDEIREDVEKRIKHARGEVVELTREQIRAMTAFSSAFINVDLECSLHCKCGVHSVPEVEMARSRAYGLWDDTPDLFWEISEPAHG